jgi:hypothetical protein
METGRVCEEVRLVRLTMPMPLLAYRLVDLMVTETLVRDDDPLAHASGYCGSFCFVKMT